MVKIISIFFKNLENPYHPLLGPTVWGVKLAHMWSSEYGFCKFSIVQICLMTVQTTEFIELWLLRHDTEMALHNFATYMPSFLCVFKSITFSLLQKHWTRIIEYVSETERHQLSGEDALTLNIIKKYTYYSRCITFSYWLLSFATLLTLYVSPFTAYFASSEYRYLIKNGSAPYPEIISSWVPMDKSRGFGYCMVLMTQAFIITYGAITMASYDTNVAVIMVFFAGQLEILRENCRRLFDSGLTKENLIAKLRYCHKHHVDLMSYSKQLDSVLSPVMFVYVIICSMMVCSNAIQITKGGVTTIEQFWIAEFFVAIVAQLFFYSWHSHQVFAMSSTVSYGVYSSAWWSVDARERRNVLLLAAQLSKTVVFNAGPFATLGVNTFVTILKGSYSYYTLLNQT